jgi:hypothetical protein
VRLPDDRNAEWPPYFWKRDQTLIEESRTWLVGNVKELAEFYRSSSSLSNSASWRRRLVERLGRGDFDAREGQPDRIHVPFSRQVAKTSASLLFSETPTFKVEGAHEDPGVDANGNQLPPTQETTLALEAEERLSQLTVLDGWSSKLLQAAYVCSGEGGVYLRPTWDPTLQAHPVLQVIHHNRAVPSFSRGKLHSVVFWSVLEVTPDKRVWRHLEHHTAGQVQHGLYFGTHTTLGTRHALGDRFETASLVADRDGFFDFRPYGIEGLLPEYVPNLLPNLVTLSGDVGSSDSAGLEDQMFALDEADTAWHGDVRVGKRRIIVDDSMLERGGPGRGATFNVDQEVFAPLHFGALNDNVGIEVVDFSIRADDFEATVTNRLNRLSIAAGYNPESVTAVSNGTAATATEILSRDALSADTTNTKRRYWEKALSGLCHKFLILDSQVFGTPVNAYRPTVVWPTTAEQDLRETASTLNLLSLAGAVSTKEKIRLLHPQWSETQVLAELEEIRLDENPPVIEPDAPLV